MVEESIVKAFVKELFKEFKSKKWLEDSLSGLLIIFVSFLVFLVYLIKAMPECPGAVWGLICIGLISLVALLVIVALFVKLSAVRNRNLHKAKNRFQSINEKWQESSGRNYNSKVSDKE